LFSLIDEEIARLPEPYRIAIVLCDLEERSQPEAARLLECTPGSLRGRLLRGRALLRSRLAHRGVTPDALPCLLAFGLTPTVTKATVPLAVATALARSAALFWASPAAARVSARAATLAREAVPVVAGTRIKVLGVLLLALGASAAGAGLIQFPPKPTAQRLEGLTSDLPATAPLEGDREKADVRRDLTGDPLPAEAVARLGTIRLRQGGLVEHLAYSPDGREVLSFGREVGVRVWDAATGQEGRRFADWGPALGVSLSPNGKEIAVLVRSTDPQDELVAIRDFATGKVLRRFGKEARLTSVLYSPDGKTLALFGWDNVIELWDPRAGRILHTLKGHEDMVWAVAFSPDGKTLVSGGDDRTIRSWDVGTGKQVRQITHTSGAGRIALTGKLLATVDHTKKTEGDGTSWKLDHRVRLWGVEAGKELRQLTMPVKEVSPGVKAGFYSLAFSPDGKKLVTGDIVDGVLRVWDPTTGMELRQVKDFSGTIGALAFSPDGKRLAVGCGTGTTQIRLIELSTGKEVGTTQGHQSFVSSLAIASDGRSVWTAGGDGTLRSWDPATGRPLRQLSISGDASYAPRLLPDGTSYLTVGRDMVFRVREVATGRETAAFRGQDLYRIALSPVCKTLATAGTDRTLRLMSPGMEEPRHIFSGIEVLGMSFTTDGRRLVVWSPDKTVSVCDVLTGKTLQRLSGPDTPRGNRVVPLNAGYTAALSPDGTLLAFGFHTGEALPIVETATGKEVCCFQAGEDGAMRLAFSPDGRTLAWAGGQSGTVYLGELATVRVRRRFTGHRGPVWSLAFSKDGKVLISGSADTTALIWDLTGRLEAAGTRAKPRSQESVKAQWDSLAVSDAAAAYRAVQVLVADPERSIPYLAGRLRPQMAVEKERLARLISELDSDHFNVRERAMAELQQLGDLVMPALKAALVGQPSAEKRHRMERLLEQQVRERWSPSGERLRTLRALEVLERAATPEARRVLEALTAGAPQAWLTRDTKSSLTRLSGRP
jgi:WD40 repeat protein